MKNINKLFAFILGAALVLLLVYNIYMHVENKTKTQLAVMGKIENTVTVTGYVVRNETVLVENDGKVVSGNKSNGERVAKDELVATVYTADVPYETRAEIKKIDEQIENLQSLLEKGPELEATSVETKIKMNIAEFSVEAQKGQGGKLNTITLKLKESFNSKIASKEENASSVINELKNKKQNIENSISGSKNNVYSTCSGVYLTTFDGYEGMFDYKNILSTNPNFIKNIDNVTPNTTSGGAVKIADNFEWYFVANVESKKLNAEKPGNTVYLRLHENNSQLIETTIASISQEENAVKTLILKGDTYIKTLFMKNKLEADVILDSDEGLKIPKEAIKIVDGVKGVYIIKKGSYVFREVDILNSNEDYVIIKRDLGTEKPHLALYDEVIVSGFNGE